MRRWTMALVAAWGAACGSARAQYSTVTSPFHGASHGFFEHIGVGFGIQGDGFFFQQNGAGGAVPPFGGFVPGAGASVGIGGPNWGVNLFAAQGSTTTLTSQAPSVTLMNGVPGGFLDASLQPFVISVIPIVADDGPDRSQSPLAERLARLSAGEKPAPRTAAAGGGGAEREKVRREEDFGGRLAAARAGQDEESLLSVAEIRRQNARRREAKAEELARLQDQARQAEQAGKSALAKDLRRRAARLQAELTGRRGAVPTELGTSR
jgi:hypothetical protein